MIGCQFIPQDEGLGTKTYHSHTDGLQKIGNSLTALIVDDCPTTLNIMSAMMEKLGYNVHRANDGIEALFYLKNSPCELVLTDFQMPTINGYELGQQVRDRFPGTRVIIMTGLTQAEVAGMMGSDIIDT